MDSIACQLLDGAGSPRAPDNLILREHGSSTRPMSGTEAAILIIDDDSAEAELITRAFRKSGFNNPMHAVTDGDEAKKYLRGEGQYLDRKRFPVPRLVLLDHRMPGTSGWEVLQWLRKDPQFMPLFVVVFSGSHNPDDEKRALELGANAFHIKPQSSEEYESVLKRIGEFWLLGGC